MKPNFEHDCENCVYLGEMKCFNQYTNTENQLFDLYVCNSKDYTNTVIARYSSDVHEYISGLESAYNRMNPMLIEAFNRANDKNLIKIKNLKFSEEEMNDFFEYKYDNFIDLYSFIYNNVYPTLWDSIKKVSQYPKCNQKTAEYIIGRIKKIEKNTNIMFIWVNKGFSVDNTLEDFEFKVAPFKIKEIGEYE